mgnify:CR=1 FL=1
MKKKLPPYHSDQLITQKYKPIPWIAQKAFNQGKMPFKIMESPEEGRYLINEIHGKQGDFYAPYIVMSNSIKPSKKHNPKDHETWFMVETEEKEIFSPDITTSYLNPQLLQGKSAEINKLIESKSDEMRVSVGLKPLGKNVIEASMLALANSGLANPEHKEKKLIQTLIKNGLSQLPEIKRRMTKEWDNAELVEIDNDNESIAFAIKLTQDIEPGTQLKVNYGPAFPLECKTLPDLSAETRNQDIYALWNKRETLTAATIHHYNKKPTIMLLGIHSSQKQLDKRLTFKKMKWYRLKVNTKIQTTSYKDYKYAKDTLQAIYDQQSIKLTTCSLNITPATFEDDKEFSIPKDQFERFNKHIINSTTNDTDIAILHPFNTCKESAIKKHLKEIARVLNIKINKRDSLKTICEKINSKLDSKKGESKKRTLQEADSNSSTSKLKKRKITPVDDPKTKIGFARHKEGFYVCEMKTSYARYLCDDSRTKNLKGVTPLISKAIKQTTFKDVEAMEKTLNHHRLQTKKISNNFGLVTVNNGHKEILLNTDITDTHNLCWQILDKTKEFVRNEKVIIIGYSFKNDTQGKPNLTIILVNDIYVQIDTKTSIDEIKSINLTAKTLTIKYKNNCETYWQKNNIYIKK